MCGFVCPTGLTLFISKVNCFTAMSSTPAKNPEQPALAVVDWRDGRLEGIAGKRRPSHRGSQRVQAAGNRSAKTNDGSANRKVGIRQVAKQAEVSVATVSMVLNNNPKITEATRRRVTRVMNELGYQPNRLAQSLSGQYTRMLAVLMPTLRHAVADPYFGELISGICDRAAKRGHKVVLEHAKPDFVRAGEHRELLSRRFVDGVLCLGFNDRHDFLADYAGRDYPVLAVNNVFPQWGLDHVVCDYRSGAEQAMTYLGQLGHRRVGMIHGAMDAYTVRTIVEVFREKARASGFDADNGYLADGKFTEEGGAEACRDLLDRRDDITAIFAGNDKMALGAVHYLTRSGRRVPQDVSVIGFDDIQYSAFTTPSMSTVHTPLYDLGLLAAERLIELVRHKTQSVAETLPTHLVLRESTSIVPVPVAARA